MLSKTMLKIDIIGQSTIIGIMLFGCILSPESFLIFGLVTFLILGVWQFCNGLIGAITFRNKTRKKYVLASIVYIIGFSIPFAISEGFTTSIGGTVAEVLTAIYFFGGCLAFTSWYYYQTYQELTNGEYQAPRSFWEYEF